MKAAFFTDQKHHIDAVYDPSAQARIASMFDLAGGVYSKAELSQFRDVDCLFSTWGFPELSEAEIRQYLPNLKAIFYAAGSVQYFARPFLSLGVRVSSAWRANSVPVIDCTTAQILLANKGFYTASRLTRSPDGRAAAVEHVSHFPGNYGAKVGLIGLGAIGSGVAEKLRGYDLEVLAYDPYCTPERAAALGVKLASLDEIFATCDVISNHVPNLPSLRGMLNASHFSLMKPAATFINTGRGAQVVEADLIAALESHPHRTAILDVTDPEPPEADSPLYTLPNVFLTPHIAGSSGRERARMGAYMADEAERFLAGEPLRHEVTPEMLETMA